MRRLPVADNGYPVPWFTPAGADGRPNFLAASGGKVLTAVNQRRCWVCGGRLRAVTEPVAFVGGPLVVVNGVSGEPPSHRECAEFAVQACPHLARPNAKRRLDVAAADPQYAASPHLLPGRPEAVVIALVTRYSVERAGDHLNLLFFFSSDAEVQWWRHGKPATRAEAAAALDASVAAAAEVARTVYERAGLAQRAAAAVRLLPAEVPADDR